MSRFNRRFWNNVNKNGPVPPHCPEIGQCWVWLDPKHIKGYGQFYVNGRTMYVHRHSWELHYDKIPEGLYVLHRCDNRACVNPEHLFLGTNDDNMLDMVMKDRQVKGEEHPGSKLTEEDVLEIRRRHIKGCSESGARPLGKIYKVCHTIILDIVNNKTWTHLNGNT